MNFSKRQLGEDLKIQVIKGYDIVRISRWAYKIYLKCGSDLDSSDDEVLECLFRMEDDPQFEYTEQELLTLAEMLIKGEKDPMKHLDGLKDKEVSSGNS